MARIRVGKHRDQCVPGRWRAGGRPIAQRRHGTGYSSLNYLRRFPIDKIKIDQSFIGEITSEAKTVRLVQAIIALARSFTLKVIAEGVENREQLAALRAERCDEIQGYLASPAIEPAQFERLLRGWKAWT